MKQAEARGLRQWQTLGQNESWRIIVGDVHGGRGRVLAYRQRCHPATHALERLRQIQTFAAWQTAASLLDSSYCSVDAGLGPVQRIRLNEL